MGVTFELDVPYGTAITKRVILDWANLSMSGAVDWEHLWELDLPDEELAGVFTPSVVEMFGRCYSWSGRAIRAYARQEWEAWRKFAEWNHKTWRQLGSDLTRDFRSELDLLEAPIQCELSKRRAGPYGYGRVMVCRYEKGGVERCWVHWALPARLLASVQSHPIMYQDSRVEVTRWMEQTCLGHMREASPLMEKVRARLRDEFVREFWAKKDAWPTEQKPVRLSWRLGSSGGVS